MIGMSLDTGAGIFADEILNNGDSANNWQFFISAMHYRQLGFCSNHFIFPVCCGIHILVTGKVMQIQIIPMGKTTVTNPNKAFSIGMQGQKEARIHIEAQKKNLPAPKGR